MHYFKGIIFIVLLPFSVYAQINDLDSEGKKHGYWEVVDEEGNLLYKGKFVHGIPLGSFERYHEDGSLQARLLHKNQRETYAKLYYPGGEVLMAEGKYFNQKRDSIWNFYSEEGILTSSEIYEEGLKQGVSEIFYADGSVSERIHYDNGIKSGVWEQYFENGNPKLKANVLDGVMYDGKYTSYYPNGRKLMEGKYVDGKKESSWYHFNEDGSIQVIYVYRADQVVEEYPKNGVFETYWPNDIKRSEYTYLDGKKHGPFEEWYNKGEWRNEERVDEFGNRYPVQKLYGTQVLRTGTYRMGELHGKVITYNEDGSIKKEETYEMGKLID